jgi:GT2 family glycosyltransferase
MPPESVPAPRSAGHSGMPHLATVHPATVHPITVVVPIYDDWNSLERCIASVLGLVDLTVHRLLLVNDCGPHVDTIEKNVLAAISGASNVQYYRNEENLGFVGTCNRAVYELDTTGNDILLLNSDAALTAGALEELSAVLHAAEHHGVVCPRSNRASIASLPFFHRPRLTADDGQADGDRDAFDVVSPLLPRWYISPVAVGFCFLVRRALIDNHGLFDPIYGLGYNEENDFCMRVNELGYSALIANHAFVPHVGSASFSDEKKKKLDADNHQKLMARYPFYLDAVRSFISYGYSAADVFAEVIASQDTRAILVDIHHLSLVYNGSTRYALSFLRTLADASLPANVTITVAAQAEAISFFKLDRYGFRVMPYRDVTGIYDVGIALAPVNHINQLIQLNDHCARWVVSHFDMIASRAWGLMLSDPMRPAMVEQGLAHADRIIALSDFSLRDAAAFYPGLAATLAERGEVVHLGSTRDPTGARFGGAFDAPLPERIESIVGGGAYVVVVGNFYPHKQVALAATALEALGVPVIAFGPIAGLPETSNRAIVTSGTISDPGLQKIIEGAAIVVFPSAYEGYGLPIADALDYGVPVVAFDTEVAREVVAGLGGGNAVRFFGRFDELSNLVSEAMSDVELHNSAAALRDNVRGLDPYGRRLLELALEQLDVPLDLPRLSARFDSVKRMERLVQLNRRDLDAARQAVSALLESESFKTGHRIVRVVGPVIRFVRRR